MSYPIYSIYWGNLLKQAMTARDFQDQLLIAQGFIKGYVIGIIMGFVQFEFEMALEIMMDEGIEKAIAISGFSKEELEDGILMDREFLLSFLFF